MYTFSNKLRNLAFAFMVVGLAGLIYGFLSAPKTIEEAKAMVAASHHSDGHGETHGEDHATAHLLRKHNTETNTAIQSCP